MLEYNGREVPEVGDLIKWSTLDGKTHEGRVIEMDSNVAIVKLADGSTKTVEC